MKRDGKVIRKHSLSYCCFTVVTHYANLRSVVLFIRLVEEGLIQQPYFRVDQVLLLECETLLTRWLNCQFQPFGYFSDFRILYHLLEAQIYMSGKSCAYPTKEEDTIHGNSVCMAFLQYFKQLYLLSLLQWQLQTIPSKQCITLCCL